MPLDNIFTACKKGDLARIKYLVETKEIDLNVRDCWDSTPLYYACHCGHKATVEYLLANGARCESNTFDGERCLYGALTDEIKRLLQDSKLLGSVKKRDEFDEFCEKMLRSEEFSDITLTIGEQSFKLHRSVLAARCPYFKEMLRTRWKGRGEVRRGRVSEKVFREFINFLYTGRITVDRELFGEMLSLAEKCRMEGLTEQLKEAHAEAEYFELSKNRVKISTLLVDSPRSRTELMESFEDALSPGVPEEFVVNPFLFLQPVSEMEEDDGFYDLALMVEGYVFYCNKVFVCTRSEYFYALVRDHFSEMEQPCGQFPTIRLRNIKPSVLSSVLHYIYSDYPSSLTESDVLEVLEAADIYLLPGLKKHCGNFLCSLICEENVVEILQISRLHGLPKLEDACAEFIAENIATVAYNSDFQSFVLSDAEEVSNRQETDTISIIDDVRFHITSKVGSFSELEDAQSKLKVIDDVLEELGLEA